MAAARLSRFIAELRRRRVFRASLAYLLGAWLLVEISSVVFPALLMPEWTHRLVVIGAIAAFPMVIVLAWVFDISPDGIEKTANAASPTLANPEALPCALLPPALDSALASICVLPLEVLSSDPEDRYLAQGVAAETSTALSKVPGVRVAARATLGAPAADLRELGAQLGVQYVLSGSLRRQGEKVRIIAELADARSGSLMWSETYHRALSDVMEVEEAIAGSIVGAFGGEQLRAQIHNANDGETQNATAWSLVHKARSHILNYTAQTLDEAETFAREAIALDPDYASAHAALADVLCERIGSGLVDDQQQQIDAAVAAIRVALASRPRDPFVLKLAGSVLMLAGEHAEAINSLKRAVEISPFDLGAWGYLGRALASTDDPGQLDEAERILERIIETAPQHPGAGFWWHHKALVATCRGDFAKARDDAQRALRLQPGLAWVWFLLANALINTGDRDGAAEALTKAAKANASLTLEKFVDSVRRTSMSEVAADRRIGGLISFSGE